MNITKALFVAAGIAFLCIGAAGIIMGNAVVVSQVAYVVIFGVLLAGGMALLKYIGRN